jgi:hypothetical protein
MNTNIQIIQFWSENPNILIQPQYISELFPTSNMTYEQQLNALTRLILLVSITLLIYSPKFSVVVVCIIMLGTIFVVHQSNLFNTNTKKVRFSTEESFSLNDNISDNPLLNPIKTDTISDDIHDKITPQNPFCNVLATDYVDNPSKLSAGPDFDPIVNQKIIDATKKITEYEHRDQPNFTNQIYRSIGDALSYEQSMRQFYSTPSTSISGDYQEMKDFFYGDMVSCKENNQFACAKGMIPRQGLV